MCHPVDVLIPSLDIFLLSSIVVVVVVVVVSCGVGVALNNANCDDTGNSFACEVCMLSVHGACVEEGEHWQESVCGPVCAVAKKENEKPADAPADDNENGE